MRSTRLALSPLLVLGLVACTAADPSRAPLAGYDGCDAGRDDPGVCHDCRAPTICNGNVDIHDSCFRCEDRDGDGTESGRCGIFPDRTVIPASFSVLFASARVDCDDLNCQRNERDLDGDGSTSCGGDCNDFDRTRSGLDRDGDGYSTCAGDCDDSDRRRHPGGREGITCDGIDQNCDGKDEWQDGTRPDAPLMPCP